MGLCVFVFLVLIGCTLRIFVLAYAIVVVQTEGVQVVSGAGRRLPEDTLPLFKASQELLQKKADAMTTQDLTLLALQFQVNGWVKIHSALPMLRLPKVLDDINREAITARLRYIAHSLIELSEQYNVHCSNYSESCGSETAADYTHMAADNASGKQSTNNDTIQQGFVQLNCCVELGVRDLKLQQIQKGDPVEDNDYLLAHLPFFQTLNLHRGDGPSAKRIKKLASKLGRLASWLLQSPKVRLYQTSLFEKNPQTINDLTGWHADFWSVPLDTMHLGHVTFWCPIYRDLDMGDGDSLLIFASGSHRDVSLGHWFPVQHYPYDKIRNSVDDRYHWDSARNLKVGDCTAHHGATWHYAALQPEDRPPRRAIAFSFVADGARVLEDLPATTTREGMRKFVPEDKVSYSQWFHKAAAKSGVAVDDPVIPVVFDARSRPALSQRSQRKQKPKKEL